MAVELFWVMVTSSSIDRSDVEKEHAEAISYLKEKLQKDDELQGSHDYTTSVNSSSRTPKK
jgi:cytochrome b